MLRPEDACQKRFSWFSDWSPKVQKHVNLEDLVKNFPAPGRRKKASSGDQGTQTEEGKSSTQRKVKPG